MLSNHSAIPTFNSLHIRMTDIIMGSAREHPESSELHGVCVLAVVSNQRVLRAHKNGFTYRPLLLLFLSAHNVEHELHAWPPNH